MKKIFILLAVFFLGFTLVACDDTKYEVAMITDTGDIDDGSFNEGTWKGIQAYAAEHNVAHKYYKPAGETTADYEAAIDLAVSKGAKIVITPGFYFETPIFNAQKKYPDVKFVLLDGEPHAGDYDINVADNTLSVYFQEEQAGFLAGYATVKEGYTKLGYMGGIAVPAVIRFGIGWVAGAYQAAQELELADFEFKAENYTYLGGFGPSDDYKTEAKAWFQGGVEVIHAAAGGAGSSVMAAAEDLEGKWVVGVDSDQAGDSPRVLSSAMKGVGEAAYKALDAFYKDQFPGGETWNLGVSDEAVGIPMDTSRFENFKAADYTALYAKVVDGTYVVPVNKEGLRTYINGLALFAEVNLDDLIAEVE